MAMFGEHAAHDASRAEKVKTGLISGGSLALAIGGAAAVILTILGLRDIWPVHMLVLSTIIVGAAFILEGIAIAGRQLQLLSRTGGTIEQTELAGGLTAEFLAGCAGLSLGIVALFGIYPIVLCASALILFGSALVFGSRQRVHYSELGMNRPDMPRTDVPGSVSMERTSERFMERPTERLNALLSPVYGTHVMVGLACIALGIIALSAIQPLVLTLVGLLSIGFVLFLSGTSVATWFVTRLAKRV